MSRARRHALAGKRASFGSLRPERAAAARTGTRKYRRGSWDQSGFLQWATFNRQLEVEHFAHGRTVRRGTVLVP